STYDPGSQAGTLRYRWTALHDGSSVTPNGSSTDSSFSFDIPVVNDGNPYTVQLTVTDQDGNSRVVTQQVLQSVDTERDTAPQTIDLSSYFSGLGSAFTGLDWADPNRTLSYSVSQANTTNSPLVASVDHNTGRLTLNYLSGAVGTDTLTVTVTDTNAAAQAAP